VWIMQLDAPAHVGLAVDPEEVGTSRALPMSKLQIDTKKRTGAAQAVHNK